MNGRSFSHQKQQNIEYKSSRYGLFRVRHLVNGKKLSFMKRKKPENKNHSTTESH